MNIEYNLGLVAGSVACLRPFFVKLGFAKVELADAGDRQHERGEFRHSYNLRTIGGGPKWRRPAQRGAATRVQGESVLDTVVTLGVGSEDDRQTDTDCESWQGSTDRIV